MSWIQELEFTKRDRAARVIQKAWKKFLVRGFFFFLVALLTYNLGIISV